MVFAYICVEKQRTRACVAVVNGRLWDLRRPLEATSRVEFVDAATCFHQHRDVRLFLCCLNECVDFGCSFIITLRRTCWVLQLPDTLRVMCNSAMAVLPRQGLVRLCLLCPLLISH